MAVADWRFQLETKSAQCRQSVEREEKLKQQLLRTRQACREQSQSCVQQISALRADLSAVWQQLTQFGQAYDGEAGRAGAVLMEAARRLERNLQRSWAEAARAAEQVSRTEVLHM